MTIYLEQDPMSWHSQPRRGKEASSASHRKMHQPSSLSGTCLHRLSLGELSDTTQTPLQGNTMITELRPPKRGLPGRDPAGERLLPTLTSWVALHKLEHFTGCHFALLLKENFRAYLVGLSCISDITNSSSEATAWHRVKTPQVAGVGLNVTSPTVLLPKLKAGTGVGFNFLSIVDFCLFACLI